jgi:hypothetical protein
VPGLQDAELVAEYGRREVRVLMNVAGGQFGVSPGTVSATPASEDFWFPEGALVSFTAVPSTGFAFQGWSGALTGQGNPAVHQATLPLQASALFTLTYRVAGGVRHAIEAAAPQEIRLVAENGTAPISWAIKAGRLPGGLTLSAAGVLTGAAMETGEFSITLEARDAMGLTASGPVVLAVGQPVIGIDALVGLFLLGNTAPTQLQMEFLDGAGNRNGVYDLGDLRAFLLANPTTPLTAEQRLLVRTLLPAFSFTPEPPPGGGS